MCARSATVVGGDAGDAAHRPYDLVPNISRSAGY
jgi:hypothetical protein